MKIINGKLLDNKNLIFETNCFGQKFDHNIYKVKLSISALYNEICNKYVIITDSNKQCIVYTLDDENCFTITQTITKNAGLYKIVLLLTTQDKESLVESGIDKDNIICLSSDAKFHIDDNGLTGEEQIIDEEDVNYVVYYDKLYSKLYDNLYEQIEQIIADEVDANKIAEDVKKQLNLDEIANDIKDEINLDAYAEKEDVYSKEETYSKDEVDKIQQNVWLPTVDSDGNISWSKNTTDEAPATTNIKGAKGDKGEDGAAGEKGDTGAAGKDGINGKDGKDGSNGLDGVSVVSVEQITTSTLDGGTNTIKITLSNGENYTFNVKNGSKGSTGEKGEKGDTGAAGKDGEQGIQGEKGEKGDKGDIGLQGEQGLQGEKGESGNDGISITNVTVTKENHLVITLSNNETIDAGAINTQEITPEQIESSISSYLEENPIEGITESECNTLIEQYVKEHPELIGKDGSNGATFTPNVDENGNLSWSNDSGLENPATVNIKGNTGEKGADGQNGLDGNDGIGISKIDFVESDIDDGINTITITLTDESTHTFNIKNGSKGDTGAAGKDGENGKDGSNGLDGVSVVSVEQITTSTEDDGINVIKVTLSDNNTFEFNIKNGSKGSTGETGLQGEQGLQGEKGEKGDTGETGAKGEDGQDYILTDEDKTEIETNIETSVKAYVDEYILGGEF